MLTNTSQMIHLNGSNYRLWKTRMMDFLYINGLHEPIACSEKPDNKTNEEWNLLHRRACGYVRQWVDDNMLTYVSEETNARTLWSKIEELRAQNSLYNKFVMIKKLKDLTYRDGIAMLDHLNTFQGIINELSETGIKFTDDVQGLWLLGTLPDSWEAVRTSVLNSTPDGVIRWVLNEEMRRKSQESTQLTIIQASTQYTTIKVARDMDLYEQIGKTKTFDLVDFDKVYTLDVESHTTFSVFKENVANEFGIPVQCLRFWHCATGLHFTCRPLLPLTPKEEAQPVGQLCEVLSKNDKIKSTELKLFLEIKFGKDLQLVPPPTQIEKKILLFFKLYDPSKGELRYVGRLFVLLTREPKHIVKLLNEMAGFDPDQEIKLFEEVQFKPKVGCDPINENNTFEHSKLKNGGIICFQKYPVQVGKVRGRYPNIPSFLKHVRSVR